MVFVAGQVGRAPSTGELPEGIDAQTEQTMENIKAILEAAGLTWANVARAMCLLADINDFEAFNGVYSRYISDPKPARATYAVKDLPRGRCSRSRSSPSATRSARPTASFDRFC